ncbi:MAG: GIY-YIG nuclease family protein [Xanthobacteraceae bacterium]|nr:GIY-YIG nuclease family protein [Xanthobacteraceae bacterium]
MSERYYVYVLANRARGVLYTGVTNDLVRRVTEHKSKLAPGFSKSYGVSNLVYYQEHSSIRETRARQAAVKRWRRARKFELIEKLNPDWRDLSVELQL